MAKNIHDYIEFEDEMDRFFDDLMSESERLDFIKKIKSDLEWTEQFQMERMLRAEGHISKQTHFYAEKEEAQQQAEDIMARIRQQRVRTTRQGWAAGIGIAALLLTAGVLAFWSLSDGQAPPPHEFPANEVFMPYPAQVDTNVASPFAVALTAYQQQHWKEAAEHFGNIVATGSDRDLPLFFQATALIYSGEAGAGLAIMESLQGSPALPYEEDAIRYYQALALVLLGRTAEGMDKLQGLENSERSFVRQKTIIIQNHIHHVLQ